MKKNAVRSARKRSVYASIRASQPEPTQVVKSSHVDRVSLCVSPEKGQEMVQRMGFASKHLPPVPVLFNTEPLDPAEWTEQPQRGQQIIGIRSVIFSDGSCRRFFKVKSKRKGRRKHARATK